MGRHQHRTEDGTHAHSHAHAVTRGPGAAARLRLAFALISLVLIVEFVVALISHSLALLADAGHVVTDLVAIGLSWFAIRQAERPPTAQRTYGYHRVGIMVALFNSTSLLVIAAYILHEAYARLQTPVHVEGALMMMAAFVGLVANLWVGHDLSLEPEENLNVKSAVLHVMGDAAASLGVIVAAAFLWWRPSWGWLDPGIAALIAVLIAVGAWQIMYDASIVLMEGVPSNINMDALVRRIHEIPGVDGVHDLHVWAIASGLPSLTCHILLREVDIVTTAAVMNAVRDVLKREFGLTHATIQPEWELCGPDNLYCTFDMLAEMPHAHSEHVVNEALEAPSGQVKSSM